MSLPNKTLAKRTVGKEQPVSTSLTSRRPKKFGLASAALALSAGLAGCASTREAPVALMSEAEADIRSAEEIGAEDHAPVALRSARTHLTEAKNAINSESELDEDEYQKVTFMLERALADAEYASAKTHAKKSQAAAEEVEQNLDALRNAL